jgi:DNA-directed RNA polymerase specialized sigma24 family protein
VVPTLGPANARGGATGPRQTLAATLVAALEDQSRSAASPTPQDTDPDDGVARSLFDTLGQDFDDAALAERLMKEGFDTQIGKMVEEILAKFGLAVMRAWIGSRTIIWQRVAALLPTFNRPAHVYWSSEQGEEFAFDAVADGLERFAKRIMSGRWSPDGGASLMAYFINGCVLAFVTEFRRFARMEPTTDLTVLHDIPARTAGPGDIAVMRDQIARARAQTGDSVMDIIALGEQGYTQPQIAALLGLTTKQVENRLRRWRRKTTMGGADVE